MGAPIAEVMTRRPRTLGSDASVRDAMELVREVRADEIPVIDGEGRPVGVLDVQDLLAMRVASR
jgi:arabinose-5-phosphate isomerase